MQTVQEFDRDDRGPGHAPKRTVSRFVTDTFSFLNEENCDDKDDLPEIGGYKGIPSSKSEPVLVRQSAVENEVRVPNGVVKDAEFTIVTTVEKSPVKKESAKSFEGLNKEERLLTDPSENVGEYTIVTYAEDKDSTSQMKNIKLPFPFNSVYIANEDGEDEQNINNGLNTADNTTEVSEGNNVNNIDNTAEVIEDNSSQATEVQRNSVIIDGDVVELRKSPSEQGERKSRQPTWKKNQAVVSEVFGFLREIEDIDNPENDTNGNDIEAPVSESNSILNDTGGDNSYNSEGISGPDSLEKDRQSCATKETNSGETDDVGELVGKKMRQRRKPKPSKQSDNADDDGDSSDEDTGVYRESFRKSTWLYIGDNENLKVANAKEYVPLADLGVETCERDSVFGDDPPKPPKTPLSGHRRTDSNATTMSEAEFKNRFNSVSKRFVKRADSQQEYKRYTAQCYDQVKAYVIQKEAGQDYGIHLLDSKPAIVSGVDAGSPAEQAGVKEGQIVTTVNGENVLELDHDDIIKLVQQNAIELQLEVGTGDVSHVIDLQRPVVTGYLQKQTSSTIFRVWKKRFFILRRDNCLYYYKTNQEQDPLGAMPLNGYNVSRHGDHHKFGFKAEKFGCRTFFFQAESRDDMTRWVGALNEAAERGNEKKDAWMDVTTQNVGLPALEIRSPDCSGYLFKQGRATKRWRKRYCVLKDACIYYYKNSNSKQAEGVAHLHGYAVDEKGLPGKKCSFCLRPPEEAMRVFSFSTDNDTDRERWVNALHKSIGKWVRVET